MGHGPVFQHRQIKATAVETDEARLQVLEILEEPLKKLFFVETGLAAGTQFLQEIGFLGAGVFDFRFQEADRDDPVERLAGDVTSQSSRARLDTLRSAQAGFGPATTHKDIAALLSSHGPGNGRLCRHTGGGQDGTISGVVYLCGPREVVFSAGIPCSAGWQSFRL